MAITTYAAFVDAIEALTVTGVAKTYQGPPASLSTADLPALWCQAPKGDEDAITFGTAGGWPTLTVDVYLAIEPAAQNLQAENFAAQVKMMDALAAALRGLVAGKAPISWKISAVTIVVAGTNYWGVIATVTGRG